MIIIYLVFALLAGIGLPLQITLNHMIAKSSSSLWASAVSFTVGMTAMFIVVFFTRQPIPTMNSLSSVPVYAWAAGLLGAFYVTTAIIVAPKIGAAPLIAFPIFNN